MSDEAMRLLRALDPAGEGVWAPPIERLLERIGEEPSGGAGPGRARSPRPPVRRRPVAVAVALACLAAVAVAAIVVGGEGREPAPPSGDPGAAVIVHTISRSVMNTMDRGGRVAPVMQGGPDARPIGTMNGPTEHWSVWSQRRSRDVTTLLPGRGMPGGTIEQTVGDGFTRTRQSWDGRVWRRRGNGIFSTGGFGIPGVPSISRSQRLKIGVVDPKATIEAMIDDGEARPAGETMDDGRRLLRFVGETERRGDRRHGWIPATRTTYLVDPVTYAPVEIGTAIDFASPGSRYAGTFRHQSTQIFDVYETLPLNARTAPSLRFGGPTR